MQCLFKTYWAISASQQPKNHPNKCHTGVQLMLALVCAASSPVPPAENEPTAHTPYWD